MFSYKSDYFLEPENVISDIHVTNQYVITTNYSGVIDVRSRDTLELISTQFSSKDNPYTCLTCYEDLLFIGRPNKFIEVWDLERVELESKFKTYEVHPRILTVSDNYLAIQGKEKIEIFNRENNEFLGFLENPSQIPFLPFRMMYIVKNRLAAEANSKIVFWNLKTLKEEYIFTKESMFNSFLLFDNFLLFGTNSCVEIGDDFCTLDIWDISAEKRITRLGQQKEEFYFDIKVRTSSSTKQLYLIAPTMNIVDIWEWKTWRHLDRIINLPNVQACELTGNYLLIGDMHGRVLVYEQEQ